MLEQLLQLDKDAFLYLNGLGTTNWDGFWLVATRTWSSLPIYILLLVLSWRTLGWKRTLVLMVSVALLITVMDQFSNFLKYGVQRLRPCYDGQVEPYMRLVKGYCGGRYGYFSAHSGNTAAAAFFFIVLLGKTYKWLVPLLLVWCLTVAYSRIYIGVHFPLDVLTGISIGFLMGWVFAKLYIFALHKYRI